MLDPNFARLFERALERVHGAQLNKTLWDLREARTQQHDNVVCYEIVLKPDHSWRRFMDDLSKLGEHLKAKGLSPLAGEELLITLWYEEHAHILDGRRFFDALQEIEQLGASALRARLERGPAPLALPPPQS